MNKQVHNKQILTLQNKCSESEKLSDFLTGYTNAFEIPDETFHDLRLVTEEIFINIASYAYADKDIQTITIEFNRTSNEINITFTDSGIAFNPLAEQSKFKTSDDHCDGGMGIHIITSLTNHQEYNRVEQSNVFTVTKHYTK